MVYKSKNICLGVKLFGKGRGADGEERECRMEWRRGT